MDQRCQFGLCRAPATESIRQESTGRLGRWMHLCSLHVRFANLY